MANNLKSLWAGDVPLQEAFWWYAALWGLMANFITSSLFMILIIEDVSAWWLVPTFLLPVPYNIFVTVAVWRSAEKYQGDPQWAGLARAATIAGMTVLTLL
jgi:hypothetical protein